MSDTVFLLVPFGVGMALGAIHFVGLWYTVKRLPDSSSPLASLFGSFLLRISLLLIGFALLMNGHWEQPSAALLGFLLAREILFRRLGRNG